MAKTPELTWKGPPRYFGDARRHDNVVELDGRLVAAAPDLYEALDRVDKAFVPDAGTSTHLLCRIPIELVQQVAAALKKARGEA